MSKHFSTPNEQTKQLANTIGIKFVESLIGYEYVKENIKLLSYQFCIENSVLPLASENGAILLAISSPYYLDILKEARFLLKKPVKEVLAPKELIRSAIELLYNSESSLELKMELSDIDLSTCITDVDKEYDLLTENNSSSVVSLLNRIFIEAIRSDASDIHFEPADTSLIVKYRIDGILFEKHTLPKGIESQLITRLKVQAELDIAETRMPQDGRIKLRMGTKEIDFRLSTVPVIFGERVVLRISDNSEVLLGLDQLDLRDNLLRTLKKDIKRKQGIILITGPTGSGKTRTLYSILSEIASSDLNIMTIEDPVENKLKSMAQINVNHKRGLTFAKGLKHILRQDPDIIMVGEIRDKETVNIAIEASLTGHLVLSTLHTNDAPSTIIRLIDMGVEPYLIASSLISVCSQRLVRKICTHCKNDDEKKINCQECSNSGYKGRRGIYEYMNITPSIKKTITGSVDALALNEVATKEGLKTLYEDGMYYVDKKITSLEEVERVTNDTKGE